MERALLGGLQTDSISAAAACRGTLVGTMEDYGAGGRTRTDMSLTSPDFESGAYTNFATPAAIAREKIIRRMVSESQLERTRVLTISDQ